jgi:aspartyl-tRNA synthetase
MTWEDAMWQYGNDKPDIRFGMELLNLKNHPLFTPIKRSAGIN